MLLPLLVVLEVCCSDLWTPGSGFYLNFCFYVASRLQSAGFFAENCCAAGIILVAVGYDLAPKGMFYKET